MPWLPLFTGPVFSFSDPWQLVIDSGTTVITFPMVFLIQNMQNQDTAAIRIKLDELIRVTQGAHHARLDLQELEEEALDAFRRKYRALALSARQAIDLGTQDTSTTGTAGHTPAPAPVVRAGGGVELGGADERTPAKDGTAERWGRLQANPAA